MAYVMPDAYVVVTSTRVVGVRHCVGSSLISFALIGYLFHN